MFETDSLPQSWVSSAADYDAVWVPGAFNQQTYTAAGISAEKVRVVHCPPPDHNVWAPGTGTRGESSGEIFQFLSVMRWQYRKGWDLLLPAFLNAFGDDPSVSLRIHASPFDPTRPQDTVAEFRAAAVVVAGEVPPNVILSMDRLTEPELVDLYRRSDAFVLPSRGEGWGRPFMEAMALGVPVIGPDWGGQLEFMSPLNALLVTTGLEPVSQHAAEQWPYFTGHQWGRPDVDALRDCLLAVRNGLRPPWDPRMSARALAESFSADRIARQVRDAIGELP
jgi:glycosyltransferase involved in cell wall biosynthesis